jgi:hypothetical protein
MRAIEESAKEASRLNRDMPMAPAPYIVKSDNTDGLRMLGITLVGDTRRLLIE